MLGRMTCKILDTPGDKCDPAGLMRGSQATPVVAVKVFVEEDEILPVGPAWDSHSDVPFCLVHDPWIKAV